MRSKRSWWRWLALVVTVGVAGGARTAEAQDLDGLRELARTDPFAAIFLKSLEQDLNNERNPVYAGIGESVERVSRGSTQFLQHLLLVQTATFPVPTSSGAFTYSFNPATRTFARRSQSFGPTFVDRANTLGRARAWSAGWSFQALRFDSLNGVKLSDAPLYQRFTYSDGRVSTTALSMDLEAQTLAFFGTFAVSDDLDVTVVAPVSRMRYRGVVKDESGTLFDSGRTTSIGFGDLETRVKWSAWRTERFEGGARYTLRLPTGKDATHGVQRAQQRLTGLLSTRVRSVQLHLNGGYAFRVAGDSPGSLADAFLRYGSMANEAEYRIGGEWAPHAKLTLTGDLVGRHIRDTVRFVRAQADYTEPDPDDPERPYGYYLDFFQPAPTNENIVLASAGAKYQLFGATLFTYQMAIPMVSKGLRAGLSAAAGWEVGF